MRPVNIQLGIIMDVLVELDSGGVDSITVFGPIQWIHAIVWEEVKNGVY